MYDPIALANYFLDLGKRDKVPIDPLKLQKLLFVAHGWHLAIHGTPLFLEPVEAWRFGPVIESVYHQFKKWGSNDIKEKAITLSHRDGYILSYSTPELTAQRAKKHLEKVWRGYKDFTGLQLTSLTHKPGAPWSRAIKEDLVQVPNAYIREHYEKRLRELQRKNA